MLELADVHTYYGNIRALRGVSLTVAQGEIVTLIGSNGAGKTTTLKTILGTTRPRRGTVTFSGQRLDTLATDRIVRLGIAQSPEGRRIFPRMTVLENLELGAFVRKDRSAIAPDLERVFALFPRLAERAAQHGGAHPAPARRAVDGPGSDPGRDDLPHRAGHQPPGHDDLAGRAERADGARRRASRLRHADRAHRAPGRRRRASALGPGTQDVSRREVELTQMGAPRWPPKPSALEAPRRSRGAPRYLSAPHRRGVKPSRSSAGMRPVIRSATIRAVPHAIVHPMWPCPLLKNRFR